MPQKCRVQVLRSIILMIILLNLNQRLFKVFSVCIIISLTIEELSGRSENEFSSSKSNTKLDNFIREEDQKQIKKTNRKILETLSKGSNPISKESIATKIKVMKNEEANQWKILKQKKRKRMLRNSQANVLALNRDIFEEYK